MEKITVLLSFLVIAGLTSMVSSDTTREPQGLQVHPDKSELKQQPRPLVEKGMITIKVKKGMDVIPAQKGKVLFNQESLDRLSENFELLSIEKRFRFNPSKMRKGLPDLSRIYKVTFPTKFSPQRVAAAFANDPAIEYAEPVPVNYPCEVPDDPYYYQQHFLPQIHAEEAWEIHKGENGAEEVVIAVVDSGVDWDHEDLLDNAWQNLGEDADGDGQVMEFNGSEWIFDPGDENGIDDDGNGFVDDFTGWNYYYDTNDPTPDDYVPYWDHGTHCAGLAAAVTNNGIGISAITWNVNFMSLHIADPEGSLPFAYDGIIYAAENGAHVITNSWGGYAFSTAHNEIIQYASGLGSIVVAGAGNDNKYDSFYPASYPLVISAASVSKFDMKATYSNFGPNIKVSSPGGEGSSAGLYSTVPNNAYNWMCGTSMATPVCAGLTGLVRSYHPEWSNMEVIAQVLGTADNIDTLNPNFVNQLGSGRINAYRALAETGVSLAQELKLDMFAFQAKDLDGDGIAAPGDTLAFDLVLRNFSPGGSDPNALFQLSCSDPHIEVIAGTHSDTIPPDNFFSLNNAFQAIIDENCTTHDVEFRLVTSSSLPVVYGDTLCFSTLVAPDGIFVYQGEGSGNAYSGTYIQNFLSNQGIETYHTSVMPTELKGFDVAFISLGNYGPTLADGTLISDPMCEAIIHYLEDGGKLYLECGSFFGLLNYLESTYIPELKDLLSIDAYETPMIANPVDTLTGLEESIAQGLFFTGSTQSPYWYIDILTPDDNGTAMLEENDYGVVAVQGEGAFGQKTVMMNYAISKLQAGEPGMTLQLMENVCEYMGIEIVELEEKVSGLRVKVQGYPNPTSGVYRIGVTLEEPQSVSWKIYDVRGMLVAEAAEQILPAGEHELVWDAVGLKDGIYFIRVSIEDDARTMKVVKAGCK